MRKLTVVVLILTLGLVAACENRKREYVPPISPFEDMAPVTLDAGLIEVARRYQPDPTSIEARMRITFDELLEDYAVHRFHPWGGDRTFRLVIRDAEITEVGPNQYQAYMFVHIQMLNAARIVEGYSIADASMTRTLPADLSVEERATAWEELTVDLIRQLDGPVTREVHNVLGAYVLTVQPAN